MPGHRKHSSPAERQRAYRMRKSEARLEELRAKGLPAMPGVPTMPGTKRWAAMNTQARALLMAMVSEMEAYRESRSEAWQASEKADELEETAEQVQEACDILEALI